MKPKTLLRIPAGIFFGVSFIAALAVATAYLCADWYGVNALLMRGGTLWPTVSPQDVRISPSMRTALRADAPSPSAGPMNWHEVSPGMEVGELSVMAEGREVDRMLLTRIDPQRFRIQIHSAPAGDQNLDDWVDKLKAVFIINGSYYDRKGQPATPLLSEGQLLGPKAYSANHGALVIKENSAAIADLRYQPWKTAFNGAHDALVSYPLLLAPTSTPEIEETGWLANRSFVAQDEGGKLVFGTTVEGYFSLHNLAAFLKKAPLDLRFALNLDGGPVACQAVALENYKRNFCGSWELQADGKTLKVLKPAFGDSRWALPVVISAKPKG